MVRSLSGCRRAKARRALSLEADCNRFASLLSIVGDRPVASDALKHIEAADRFWQRGDRALANLRLIFADLPRLADLTDAYRLTLAAHLLDEGMTPDALTKELGHALATRALKCAPSQARIPAGHGRESGEFTFGQETARRPAPRIVLAETDDDPADNKDYLSDQSSSVQLPHKGPHFPHPPILTPGPPPPPPMPRIGGAGDESGPSPEKQPPNARALPPSIGVGQHASESIPAGPTLRPNPAQQKDLNRIGVCHTCGTTDPGTGSGNFVGDHQDPNALVSPGTPQRYYPQCIGCSRRQGGLLQQFLRRRVKQGDK